LFVSIPHRKFKNGDERWRIRFRKSVSIPHRKFKNVAMAGDVVKMPKFPSLIGSLKTDDINVAPETNDEFPSLIGSLKTLPIMELYGPSAPVSIPHRKFKNYDGYSR